MRRIVISLSAVILSSRGLLACAMVINKLRHLCTILPCCTCNAWRGCGNRYRSEKPGRIIELRRDESPLPADNQRQQQQRPSAKHAHCGQCKILAGLACTLYTYAATAEDHAQRDTHTHTNKWLINLRECDRTMRTMDGRVRTTHTETARAVVFVFPGDS